MELRKVEDTLRGKNLLITGGTGSFGQQIVKELFQYEPAAISIFSRDEKKQYDMQQQYRQQPHLRFLLGSVRDFERLREVMRGIDIVFHAAALKQVPNCEFAPYEAVKTNVEGAENVRRAALEAGVDSVVAISTDKAVKPVNVMGMTKALQERIFLDPSHEKSHTRFLCVRYGNVLGSRGSVVPLFCEYITRGQPLPITDPEMTRFQLTLSQAVQLVFRATAEGETGDLWVRKMPAANVVDLGTALAFGLTGRRHYPTTVVGSRPGEKIHEVLVSEEEMLRAEELDDYYLIRATTRLPEPRPVCKPAVAEYASNGTHLLSESEILSMLAADGWIRRNIGPGPKALGIASIAEALAEAQVCLRAA